MRRDGHCLLKENELLSHFNNFSFRPFRNSRVCFTSNFSQRELLQVLAFKAIRGLCVNGCR